MKPQPDPSRPESQAKPATAWLLVLPAAAFALYCALYLPLASPPGGDAPYYLLGVSHLDGGQMAWRAEPPLAFLLLWPLGRIMSPLAAFTTLGAALAAGTVYLVGLLTFRAAGARHLRAGLLAQLLVLLYASPQFVNCFLKNGLANLLMVAAIAAWFAGPPRRTLAALAIVLALLAHPGAVAPLLVAIAVLVPRRLGGWHAALIRRASRVHGPPRLAVVAAIVVGTTVAALAWPTAGRYLTGYLSTQAAGTATAFSTWDLGALLMRYWPLGLMLAAGALRDMSPTEPRQVELPRLLGAWSFVLLGLSAVGQAAGRRLELQLYLPLVPLAVMSLARWAAPLAGHKLQLEGRTERAPRRDTGRAAAVLLILLAIGFGFSMLGASLHPKPLLTEQEQRDLSCALSGLPPGSMVVAHGTSVTYWVEYLTGVPALLPGLMTGRALDGGPVYLLTENPTRAQQYWPEDMLQELAADGRETWRTERFVLWLADYDAVFLAGWAREPHRSPLELLPVDQARCPADAAYAMAGDLTRGAGWILFLPIALLLAGGMPVAAAFPLGVAGSYVLWDLSYDRLRQRRKGAAPQRPPAESTVSTVNHMIRRS